MENDLVFKGENGKALTTSLKVAQTFGKKHRRVMQDIRELNCSDKFRLHNFVQSSYKNEQNKEQPMFTMTKDGFTLLAMGYTGKKAMEFKEKYIAAFNEMEQIIIELKENNNPKVPQTFSEALRLAADQQERIEQQKRLIEEQAPKVAFTNAIEASKSSCLIGELAKIITQNGYKIGQNRLFEWMRNHGYLGTKGEYYNIPSQMYIEQGLFDLKKGIRSGNDGVMHTTMTTKVTGKGQRYFINKFLGGKQVCLD